MEEKNADAKISPVKVALLAYGLSLLTALGLALLFKWTGLFTNVPLATILFATVALGVVISVLKENELLAKPLGQTLLLIAVLGEVVPLLALTIYSSLVSGRGGSIWLIGLLFIAGALMLRHFRWFFPALSKFNKATTQVDMRLAFAIIFSLVVLAEHVGAENILGAFVAGIVIKLLKPSHATEEKLDAIGYGFLIPFFFILTGAKLNIPSLLADRQTLILIPLFFAAYVIAKLPAFLGLKMRFNTRNAFAGTLLSSTTITLVLAVLTVAQDLKVITTQQASAFILAGILTCLAGPLAFNKLRILEADDFKKTIVHFLGTNIVTVNASKRLNTDLYDINFYTNLKENFNTYNYLQNVHFLPGLNVDKLIADKVFDADILVCVYPKHIAYRQLLIFSTTNNADNYIDKYIKNPLIKKEIFGLKDYGALFTNNILNEEQVKQINDIENDNTEKIGKMINTNNNIFNLDKNKIDFVGFPTLFNFNKDNKIINEHLDMKNIFQNINIDNNKNQNILIPNNKINALSIKDETEKLKKEIEIKENN